MKRLTYLISAILVLSFALPNPAEAQRNKKNKKQKEAEPYEFTIEVEHDRTSLKNQGRSSTCWSFSGTSFLESEIIRKGGDPAELSIMFTVMNTYLEKADRYARWHGNMEFGPGGAFHDVTHAIEKYGIVPLEVYPGNKIGADMIMHGEMDGVLKGYMDALIKTRKPTNAWESGFEGLVTAYLGERPTDFEYKGKAYTPHTYAESLGLNMDDYIEISSFNHHPFYDTFVLEVPDNWLRGLVYNVPLDDLIRIVRHSIESGYTVAWAADLGKGFSFQQGVGVVPPDNWDGKTFKPGMEPIVDQERRQKEFDNYSTTDDHGMHFVGIAKDQKGSTYFLEKNSWGPGNKYKGYSYVSEQYVRLKTTCIMINKNALPEDIKAKLGL